MARQQTRRVTRRFTGMLLVAALVTAACDHRGEQTSSTAGGTSSTGAAPRLFGVRLSEGTATGGAAEGVPLVAGDPVEPERVSAILQRLPEWLTSATDPATFNWPTPSSAPPRAGKLIDQEFPPDEQLPPAEVPSGDVTVLRHQPDGDVSIAPYIAITFDRPMVAVTTVSQLADVDVPVVVTPALEGRWQWIGTRTLRFDAAGPVDRLPMATSYTVTVPKGMTAADGSKVAADVSWQFRTPPPTVQSFTPEGEGLDLDQVFVAVFDQLIDPAAVLATITLRAGSNSVAIREATDTEIAADDTARMVTEQVDSGRWLAFVPVQSLPADTALTVQVGPNVPSAEGPDTDDTSTAYSGRTYAPLRIVSAGCGGSACPPGSDMYVQFNNVLDPQASDAGIVSVSPALTAMTASVQYSTLVVGGNTVPRTTYTITVPGSFTDIHGQKLGSDQKRTVAVGPSAPSIGQLGEITTLDPFAEKPVLSVMSVGHDRLRVRAFAADYAGFSVYRNYVYERDYGNTPLPGWQVLADETLSVQGNLDNTSVTDIDLSEVLGDAPGAAIVLVEPVPAVPPSSNDYWMNRPAITWVQRTTLGVDAVADTSHLVVWATDLRSGEPREGVQLDLVGATADAVTTAVDGLATLPLPSSWTDYNNVLVATDGDETALLPVDAVRMPIGDLARWYVFDDRAVYQPGETMKVKGWVRRVKFGAASPLVALRDGDTVAYRLLDSYGVELSTGTTEVHGLGGFELSVEVPETANLGNASLELTLSGETALDNTTYYHGLQVQQYRRPEFEVTARAESATPHISTHAVTVAAAADYYAGGPLVNSPVTWSVTTHEAAYSPPGWGDFTFGVWTPWWGAVDMRGGDKYEPSSMPIDSGWGEESWPVDSGTVATYQGSTDSNGEHYLQLDFEAQAGGLPDLPVSVSAEATVTDVSRQAWAGTTALLVHAADRYVGLRSDRAFVRQGDPLVVQAVVTDIDGAAVAGVALTVRAGRVEWVWQQGGYAERIVDEQTCTVTTAASTGTADAVQCEFETAVGGQYRVTAVVDGTDGGRNRTELTTWVSGAGSEPQRGVAQESLTVVPDWPSYQPGDTAQLLVQAPFSDGHGVMVLAREGVRETHTFEVTGGSAELQVPITERDIPTLSVLLEVAGSAPRLGDDGKVVDGAPERPAYAVGSIALDVPPLSRTLTVAATPRATQLEPGGATAIDVHVTDSAGAPVGGAEFAAVVVDEAVLALSGYTLADPLAVFYSAGWEYLSTMFGRSQVQLLDPNSLVRDRGSGDGEDSGGASESTAAAPTTTLMPTPSPTPPAYDENGDGKNQSGTIDVRTNFDALALFAPTVSTDANGNASVDVQLPDTLTRYRVMVVAVSGADRFGTAESTITARLPLSVRPSAPRFANYGDQFELPVLVQNNTDAAMDVEVVLQVDNLTPDVPTGQRVSVPANDRVEVRFPVSTQYAGTAAYRVAAVSGEVADAVSGELPVYTPATTEAFATYGNTTAGVVAQPILAPDEVIPQFGGLEVTTSSTALQALTDAMIDLVEYPYDSNDARASRILAIASLRNVLDAFDAEGLPSATAIETTVRTDIDELASTQLPDGGWGWWRWTVDGYSDPWSSLVVTHALVAARAEGYTVADGMLENAFSYLADIESHIPPEYGEQQRDQARAYALWILHSAGRGDPAKALQLYTERGDELTVDSLAWLWTSIDDTAVAGEIARVVGNRAVETAESANFAVAYDDSSYMVMQSDRRTDAVVLDALLTNDSGNDLVPKVVNGLLDHRVAGKWDSVQEDAFVLVALRHYFDKYEATTPNLVAKVWLGDRYAGEQQYAGRTTDSVRLSIPMTDVLAAGDTKVTVQAAGTGRLYYRIGIRYAPFDLDLDALDRGFVVQREYVAVDDPGDVWRTSDGTWHVKAGARVRVNLTMVAESQRTHVALVDPLPAGLESVNPVFAVSQSAPTDTAQPGDGAMPYYDWWWYTWYQFQQLRSDRSEAFTTYLPAGTHTYSYIARATTPGTFVVPPARAEEMYAPETFGRSTTDLLTVSG